MISLTETFGENVKVCVYPMYILEVSALWIFQEKLQMWSFLTYK